MVTNQMVVEGIRQKDNTLIPWDRKRQKTKLQNSLRKKERAVRSVSWTSSKTKRYELRFAIIYFTRNVLFSGLRLSLRKSRHPIAHNAVEN